MSENIHTINNFLESTRSFTATSRKKFLADFENMMNQEVIEELNNNTRQNVPGLANWHYIFHIAHQILIEEAEKYVKHKKKHNSSKQLTIPRKAITLMTSTVHAGVDYLKLSALISSILQVFNENTFICLRATYLMILVQYVLPKKQHLRNYNKWQALLRKCVDFYQSPKSDLNKVQLAEAIRMIVRKGCLQSRLMCDVKELLPFSVEVLKDVNSISADRSVAVLQMVITICEEVCSERRFALSKFSEIVMSDIMKFAYISLENIDIYNFLLMFLRVHHPRGVRLNHDAAYAFDRNKWQTILDELAVFVIKCDFSKRPESLMQLACETFNQTIDMYKENISHRHKRIRLFSESVVDILHSGHVRSNISAAIVTQLLKKYPQCLKQSDFLSLIKMLKEHFSNLTNHVKVSVFTDLCHLAIELMKLEKVLFEKGYCQEAVLYWDWLWDETMKQLTMNTKQNAFYELLSSFIVYNNVDNPYDCLKFYLTRIIRWTPQSMNALLIFCQHVPLPKVERLNNFTTTSNHKSQVIKQLLQWTLKVPWWECDYSFPLDDLGELVVSLAAQSFRKRSKLLSSKFDVKQSRNLISTTTDNIERCYLSLSFENDFPSWNKSIDIEPVFIPLDPNDTTIITCLLSHFTNFLDEKESIKTIILKSALIVKVASILDHSFQKNQTCIFRFASLIQEYLKCIEHRIMDDQFLNVATADIVKIIQLILLLYNATSLSNTISTIVVSATSCELIERIWSLCEHQDLINNSTMETSIQQSNDLANDKLQLRCSTVRLLATIACLRNNEGITDVQKNLLTKLFDQANYIFQDEFEVVATVLDLVREQELGFFNITIINSAINFCCCLFDLTDRREDVVRWLLRFLPRLFQHANYGSCNIEKILQLLIDCHEDLNANHYGLGVNFEFVKCVCEFTRLEPAFILLTETNKRNGNRIEMRQMILSYVDNPFFLVRLETVNFVRYVFSSSKISHLWKIKIFEQLQKTITNLINMNQEKEPDESAMTLSSGVYILAATILSDNYFQNEVLFTLLFLQVNHNINLNYIQKILKKCSKEESTNTLIIANLKSLLFRWFVVEKMPLQKFPYSLLSYSSTAEFCKHHVAIIFPLVLENVSLPESLEFFNSVGLDFSQTLESCFVLVVPWLLCESTTSVAAEQILKNLRKNLQEFHQILIDNLDGILLEIVGKLYDQKDFYNFFNLDINIPRENKLELSVDKWHACLLALEKDFLTLNQTLIEFLVTRKPDVIQKVLLNLIKKVYDGNFMEVRLLRLYQYIYFTLLLLKSIHEPFFDLMSTFFVRTIGFDLLHLMNEDDLPIAEAACKCLVIIVKTVCQKRPMTMSTIFKYCIRSLIRLNRLTHSSSNFDAPNLLRFLIIEEQSLLQPEIAKLRAFPNMDIFEELQNVRQQFCGNTNLETEINRFLTYDDDVDFTCSIERIRHLYQEISNRPTELHALEDSLNSADSVHCDSSTLLQRLIFQLIKLTGSKDDQLSLEATKCLGSIGIVNLSSQVSHNAMRCERNLINDIHICTYRIARFLVNGIIKKDITTREHSAVALYALCSSTWGRELLRENQLRKFENSNKDIKYSLQLDFISPFLLTETQDINMDNECLMAEVSLINQSWSKKVFNIEADHWNCDTNDVHANWIIQLTCNVAECIQKSYFQELLPIFRSNPQFCEEVLPLILRMIVQLNEDYLQDICSVINHFFLHHFGKLAEQPRCDPRSARVMLDVVQQLHHRYYQTFLNQLDFCSVARAACHTRAHFSAVCYAEFACDKILVAKWKSGRMYHLNDMDKIDDVWGEELQRIIHDEYVAIGDPDFVYGCHLLHIERPGVLARCYRDTKQWLPLIFIEDNHLKHNDNSVKNVIYGLQQLGLDWTAGHIVSNNSPKINSDLEYNAAWRLRDWNVIDEFRYERCTKKSYYFDSYYSHHYRALKYFSKSMKKEMQEEVEKARLKVICELRNTSTECHRAIYPILTQLQQLIELEYFATLEFNSALENCKVLSKACEFEFVEPVLAQRAVLCHMTNCSTSDMSIAQVCFNTYIQLAEMAMDQGYLNKAVQFLDTASIQQNDFLDTKHELQYKKALLAISRDEKQKALFLLKNLMSQQHITSELKAEILLTYGKCISDLRTESPRMIKNHYQMVLQLFESVENPTVPLQRARNEAQVALAHFADLQYKQLEEYMRSKQFFLFKHSVTLSNAPKTSTGKGNNPNHRRAVRFVQKQDANDLSKLSILEQEKTDNLLLALECYTKVLEQCDDFDYLISRVTSLWMDHRDDERTNTLVNENLKKIPSYKFIPLLPQMAAHLSNNTTSFSKMVEKIIERCALEHPHHTLPTILALKNHQEDFQYFSDVDTLATNQEPRVIGAQNLIKKLMKTHISNIIKQNDLLAHALISLAYLTIDIGHRKVQVELPKDHSILKIRNFEFIIIPTISMKINKNGNYEDQIIGVHCFDNKFNTVGGINAPKRIICIGTDGRKRSQLLKGRDDLRQDAIMQQIFTEVNSILQKNKETKQRNLRIRTYKVVPLTQRSGVLEWCENTEPIVSILIGEDYSSGLHKKYFPADYTGLKCKQKMAAVVQESNDVKLKEFLDCCLHLHPVFHYFFMENYLTPNIWFERRLAYIRSVATTSVIGYIVGLGDRHLNNILLDKITAEVIHIDFGIAFEQGNVLSIPETVPFRLTRDIEVAMGITAKDGVFKRCCEKMLEVLREQKDAILMLIEVLLYDPLFSWVISSESIFNQTDNTPLSSSTKDDNLTCANKQAQRALLRVQQRLQGIEGGTVISVCGQTERLIQQARDPVNLCSLFAGWQPYL